MEGQIQEKTASPPSLLLFFFSFFLIHKSSPYALSISPFPNSFEPFFSFYPFFSCAGVLIVDAILGFCLFLIF